jgi:hypothetical protein
LTKEKIKSTATNSTYPKVAVQCFADSFVVNQSLVLRINICGENATFAKPQNVTSKSKNPKIKRNYHLNETQIKFSTQKS